jgi:hypothetical protein
MYGPTSESAEGRYSPAECIGARKTRIEGNPDIDYVSTSMPSAAILQFECTPAVCPG